MEPGSGLGASSLNADQPSRSAQGQRQVWETDREPCAPRERKVCFVKSDITTHGLARTLPCVFAYWMLALQRHGLGCEGFDPRDQFLCTSSVC